MGQDTPAPLMGYPDMGAGIFSRALPYRQWFEFNCAQRVHQNNVEHLAWTMPSFLIGGLFFPRTAAALGTVVIGGREIYRYGYMTPDGPNSKVREKGAYPLNIAEAVLAVSVTFIFLRYQFGGFVSRRRISRYFTETPYQKELEKLMDK